MPHGPEEIIVVLTRDFFVNILQDQQLHIYVSRHTLGTAGGAGKGLGIEGLSEGNERPRGGRPDPPRPLVLEGERGEGSIKPEQFPQLVLGL